MGKYEAAQRISVEKNKDVVLDDYYYKWLARELARNKIASDNPLLALFRLLPMPDKVIVLQRKVKNHELANKTITRMEYKTKRSDYLAFQAQSYKVLKTLVNRDAHFVDFDTDKNPVSKVLNLLGMVK